MRVVLLDNIKGLGQMGDIKNVADGYGRNFLIPRNLAKLATPNTEKETKLLKEKLAKMIEEENKNVQALTEKLKHFVLEIKDKANKNGTLYEGVDQRRISDELAKKDLEISEEKIILQEDIKKVGDYTVPLKLSDSISSELKLKIEPQS